MTSGEDDARRDAFLWKVAEQFEGLARWVVEPLIAEAWDDGSKAVFAVRLDDYELLRFSASFDDEGAGQRGWNQKLNLDVEWRGETTREALMLGWKGTEPDLEKGLDSRADFAEGECAPAMGQVVQLLRDKLAAAFAPDFARAGTAMVDRELTTQPRSRFAARVETPERPGQTARARTVPEREEIAPLVRETLPSRLPDIELLQASLGELADLGGLRAEKVFAGFIKAAGSGSSLSQGSVSAFLQGALLDLYLYQRACLDGPAWLRPRTVAPEGGPLRDAVLRVKAVLFEGNDEVRRQVAREMVTAMRIYYEQALKNSDAPKDGIVAIVKSAFNNAGTIANDAVKRLGGSLSVQGERGGRRSLLPGPGLE